MNKSKYQTLSEFLREPFWQSGDMEKLSKYEMMYKESNTKIVLNAHTKIDNSYYFHIKIPSESQKDGDVYYDVVIRFFTDNPDSLKSSHLRDYYIQFFSNSPGFIYTYAVVYRMKGYLIDILYQKLDPDYFDKLPEKTNSELKLSYDKSIYFACKYLSERRFKVLNKFGIPLGRNLSPGKFFKEIKDFQTIKLESDLANLEKKSLKDLDRKLSSLQSLEKGNKKRQLDNHRKNGTKSTSGNKGRSGHVAKKTGSKSTSGIHVSIKKVAQKTTRKK